MNNKYNDLKSINKWANIYWAFVGLMLISVIILVNSPIGKEFADFVSANMTLSPQQYFEEFKKMYFANSNNIAFNIGRVGITFASLAIIVTTIVSMVQIISFNGKYNDPKYKAMVYSIFLLIISMIPLFYIIVSVMTRKSAIEQEKNASINA